MVQSRSNLRVVILLRRPHPNQHSVERIFSALPAWLPPDIECELAVLPFESQGTVSRIRNILFTARLKGDVVHIAGDVTYCALAVRRARCVVTILDLVSLYRLGGWRRRVLAALWYRAPLRWTRTATTISPAVRNELRTVLGLPVGSVSVIGCPVRPELVPPSVVPPEHSPTRILQIGTGSNKNLERVIEAVAALDCELRIVGKLRPNQLALLTERNIAYSVSSNLSDHEMRAEYWRSAVLVYVSLYEGFGMPIVEAQACGLPVVTSCTDPMAWVAGRGAVLVDPLSSGAIREAVDRVLRSKELQRDLVQRGYENARRFDVRTVAAQYAAVYRSVTRNGSDADA